ncbi:MAG: GNAT family N-acetyltransferase [Acidobacteriota bacterium]|nr:GNAT family N-acetyltransferase [Acidobacteriota bacterium]
MKLTLRPYEPGDFEALYRIDRACYEPGIAYSRRMLREYLELPESRCLVALLGQEIAGFVIAVWQDWYAHVITIDVGEQARRHGVGSALMSAIEKQMAQAGVRMVELETALNNHPAIAFWQKLGYRAVSVYPRYYQNRTDAYRMVKEIASVRFRRPRM